MGRASAANERTGAYQWQASNMYGVHESLAAGWRAGAEIRNGRRYGEERKQISKRKSLQHNQATSNGEEKWREKYQRRYQHGDASQAGEIMAAAAAEGKLSSYESVRRRHQRHRSENRHRNIPGLAVTTCRARHRAQQQHSAAGQNSVTTEEEK